MVDPTDIQMVESLADCSAYELVAVMADEMAAWLVEMKDTSLDDMLADLKVATMAATTVLQRTA